MKRCRDVEIEVTFSSKSMQKHCRVNIKVGGLKNTTLPLESRLLNCMPRFATGFGFERTFEDAWAALGHSFTRMQFDSEEAMKACDHTCFHVERSKTAIAMDAISLGYVFPALYYQVAPIDRANSEAVEYLTSFEGHISEKRVCQ